jgi:hypothetical protein
MTLLEPDKNAPQAWYGNLPVTSQPKGIATGYGQVSIPGLWNLIRMPHKPGMETCP